MKTETKSQKRICPPGFLSTEQGLKVNEEAEVDVVVMVQNIDRPKLAKLPCKMSQA